MSTAFLSYSTKDHHFAELARMVLAEEGIELWQDNRNILAGKEWRAEIDRGVSECDVVIVAWSSNSANSSFVTYEWSYGLGKGKPIIPIMLEDCEVHPRLVVIQHLNFSIPGNLPWNALVERINEVEVDADAIGHAHDLDDASPDAAVVREILGYLDQRGYQMASFERLRRRVDEKLTDEDFIELIQRNNTVFRSARLKGGKPGLAKLRP